MSPDSVPLPFGVARRLGQPRASRIAVLGSGDIDAFRRVLDRSWLSWRDGSMVGTGGVGNAINPATGLVQSGPMTMDLAVPGAPPIRMGFAWDQITNLCSAVSNNTQLASNTLEAATLRRTIVENNATAFREAYSGNITLTDGASYRLCAIVYRSAGARHAALHVSRTGQAAGVIINLTTGALTNIATGGGSVSASTRSLGGGRWLVTAIVASSAWGGNPQVHLGLSSTGNSLDTYAGDGTSGVTFEGVTLTPLTDYAPLLAEGITRTADSWICALPAALPQDCEITHIGMQPYADGYMGISQQAWMISVDRDLRIDSTGATTLRASAYNSAPTLISDTYTRTIPNRATTFVQRSVVRSTEIEAGYGASLSGSPTSIGTAPWQHPTGPALRVGFGGAPGRASRAANTLIITPGGCTQAEREAMARLMHLKPVGLAA